MTAYNQDIVDLIGSRICHDLISPIGAIGNGVELLTMSGGCTGPEMDLIAESVENANAMIRFFRIAFGAATAEQKCSRPEISSILQDMTRSGRVVIDWQLQDATSRQQVKLAFLLLQCFETAMPWGGRITVSLIGTEWAIYGQADKLNIDTKLWDHLTRPDDTAKLDAAHIHFALAPIAANTIGRRLTLECSENSARVRF